MAAAAELKVTPAAVSQQVRNLEAFYRRRLFSRLNNRIVLTDAGQVIYAGVTPALEDIASFTRRILTGSGRAKLVVSVIPSLAECWFMPALAAFTESGRLARIDVRVEDDPVDLSTGEIDLRLCYGMNLYADLMTISLFRDEVVPLCTPKLADRLDVETADDGLFIHTSWGESFASLPTWADWFAQHAVNRSIDLTKGQRVGSSLLAIESARRGFGIALAQRQLADEHIRNGALAILSPKPVTLGHEYCAVYPHGKARRPGLKELIEFLKSWATRR